VQFLALRLFLQNGAEKAMESIRAYRPCFSNLSDYFAFKDSLAREFDAVSYDENGIITLHV
jgi:hypothetical protein